MLSQVLYGLRESPELTRTDFLEREHSYGLDSEGAPLVTIIQGGLVPESTIRASLIAQYIVSIGYDDNFPKLTKEFLGFDFDENQQNNNQNNAENNNDESSSSSSPQMNQEGCALNQQNSSSSSSLQHQDQQQQQQQRIRQQQQQMMMMEMLPRKEELQPHLGWFIDTRTQQKMNEQEEAEQDEDNEEDDGGQRQGQQQDIYYQSYKEDGMASEIAVVQEGFQELIRRREMQPGCCEVTEDELDVYEHWEELQQTDFAKHQQHPAVHIAGCSSLAGVIEELTLLRVAREFAAPVPIGHHNVNNSSSSNSNTAEENVPQPLYTTTNTGKVRHLVVDLTSLVGGGGHNNKEREREERHQVMSVIAAVADYVESFRNTPSERHRYHLWTQLKEYYLERFKHDQTRMNDIKKNPRNPFYRYYGPSAVICVPNEVLGLNLIVPANPMSKITIQEKMMIQQQNNKNNNEDNANNGTNVDDAASAEQQQQQERIEQIPIEFQPSKVFPHSTIAQQKQNQSTNINTSATGTTRQNPFVLQPMNPQNSLCAQLYGLVSNVIQITMDPGEGIRFHRREQQQQHLNQNSTGGDLQQQQQQQDFVDDNNNNNILCGYCPARGEIAAATLSAFSGDPFVVGIDDENDDDVIDIETRQQEQEEQTTSNFIGQMKLETKVLTGPFPSPFRIQRVIGLSVEADYLNLS